MSGRADLNELLREKVTLAVAALGAGGHHFTARDVSEFLAASGGDFNSAAVGGVLSGLCKKQTIKRDGDGWRLGVN